MMAQQSVALPTHRADMDGAVDWGQQEVTIRILDFQQPCHLLLDRADVSARDHIQVHRALEPLEIKEEVVFYKVDNLYNYSFVRTHVCGCVCACLYVCVCVCVSLCVCVGVCGCQCLHFSMSDT